MTDRCMDEWLGSLHCGGVPGTIRDVVEEIVWHASVIGLGPNGVSVDLCGDEGVIESERLIETWVSAIKAIKEES